MDDNAHGSFQQLQGELMQRLKDATFRLTEAGSDGEFDIMASDEPVKVKTVSIDGSDPTFKCNPGSMLSDGNCGKKLHFSL